MTGHLLGAAGAIEAMFCIKAINDGIIPPTINHADGDDDPEIDYKLNFTFNKKLKKEKCGQHSPILSGLEVTTLVLLLKNL